jgi:hypothetical protein
MGQLGHTDPAFTLRVYAHMMRRNPDERERLRALVEDGKLPSEKAYKRHTAPPTHADGGMQQHPQATKNPRDSGGFSTIGAPGFEPGTSPTRIADECQRSGKKCLQIRNFAGRGCTCSDSRILRRFLPV